MPKSAKLDLLLEELQSLRTDPNRADTVALLHKALRGNSGYAAAKAAQIAAELELSDLAGELERAFERCMHNPIKTDPGCRAKAAIADALYRLAHDDPTLFLRGIRYRQLEPVYGGRVDTAADLRAACAFGLVRMNYHDVLVELADLLADSEAPARAAAAQALAYSGIANAVPLLRLKALSGDTEPAVVGECLTALLKLDPDGALPFVTQFLDREEEPLAEAAALALGGSRHPPAFPILRDWWERSVAGALRRTALLAIAMLRRDDAMFFLLSTLSTASTLDARDTLAALRIYRHDETVRQQVLDAVAQRRDPALTAAVAKQFAPE